MNRDFLRGTLSQIDKPVAVVRRRLGYGIGMVALLALATRAAAQGDTVPAGPPPHFVAAWAPPGTVVDVSRTGTLQNRVTVDLTDAPIDTAIAAIRQRAGLKLLYLADIFPAGQTVSIHATDVTAASALAEVLIGTGIDITMLQGGHLVLAKCIHLPAGVAGAGGDSGVVAGRVTDRITGTPLGGAVVTVEGSRRSATANAEGRYRLVDLPAGRHVMVARYIGYAPSSDTVLVGPGVAVRDPALAPSAQPLEQVVVTSTLVPTEVKALPVPITIITADDIRRQNVMRLDQLFRGQVAGTLAWDRPTDDYYNTITVRGVTSFATLAIKTFVDGIEIAAPQFTALIDPNSIDHIELVRGPQASTMYGSDALGGVLQVFTKKGKFGFSRPGGEIKSSASFIDKNNGPGTALRMEDAVSLRGGEGRTRYQAAAYYRRDGEWTPSYHNTNWSVTASAENINGPLASRITALFARKIYDRAWSIPLRDAGYVGHSVPPFQTIDLQTQTYGLNFVYAARSWWRHDLIVGYDRWAFGLVQTRRRLTTPADTLLQVVMNQRGKMSIFYYTTINAKLSRAVGATLTTGFNHYALDGSDASNPATVDIVGTLTGTTSVARTPSTNSGYFAQAQLNVAETVFLTAGLRAETSPGFGTDIGTVVSPRFGMAYVRPVGSVTAKLRASYGESIRAPDPSLNQPFLTAGFERLYNPALRPERQRGSDVGIDLHWGSRASLGATYYSQSAIGLVDQVLLGTVGDPLRAQTQMQNVGNIKNRGWEFEARYGFGRWQASGAFSITQSRIQELDPAYSGDYQVGDRVFDVPRHSTGVTIAYNLAPGTLLRATMTSVGDWAERDFVAFVGPLYGVPPRPSGRDYWVTYPGFTKFRVGIEQKLWRDVTGTFDVDNVTSRRVVETRNIDIPSPRTFTLALRASY